MKKCFFRLMFISLIFLATAPALFAQNGCISAEIVYPSSGPPPPPPDVDLGKFLITAAVLPPASGGAVVPLQAIDYDGDGKRDVFVSWSEDVLGAKLAEIRVNPALCMQVPFPRRIDVRLTHWNSCTLRAYDSANILVDTATASPGPAVQQLTLTSPTGITRIEIIGKEIIIKCICWNCDCPLLGDVNGDGVIDIIDALLTAQYSVGLSPAGFNPACADVNWDGTINIIDALLIAQFYVSLISSFPCNC